MRIAQILSGVGSGAARHCLLLSRELAARGHDVTLFFGGRGSDPGGDFHAIRVVETSLARRPSELRRVHGIMDDLGIEVMHTHLSRASAFGALLRLFSARRGLVATAHSRHIQPHWWMADLVIAPSRPTAEYHHRFNLVPWRRIAVIPNFADVSRFTLATPERRRGARAMLRLPNDAFVVGCVGGFHPRKNQSDLVRAVGLLARRGVAAHLVLVGVRDDPGEVARVDHAIAEYGLTGWVVCTGERKDVPDLLCAFDVYAQTARVEELPLAVLEAMATGLPIFGTAVGGVPEVVPPTDLGNLVAQGDPAGLADRLAAAARAPDALRAMAARLPAAVNAVSPDAIVPRIVAAFEQVARGRRRNNRPLAKA